MLLSPTGEHFAQVIFGLTGHAERIQNIPTGTALALRASRRFTRASGFAVTSPRLMARISVVIHGGEGLRQRRRFAYRMVGCWSVTSPADHQRQAFQRPVLTNKRANKFISRGLWRQSGYKLTGRRAVGNFSATCNIVAHQHTVFSLALRRIEVLDHLRLIRSYQRFIRPGDRRIGTPTRQMTPIRCCCPPDISRG